MEEELNTTAKLDEMGRLKGTPACHLCKAKAPEVVLIKVEGTENDSYFLCWKCYDSEKRKAVEEQRALINKMRLLV